MVIFFLNEPSFQYCRIPIAAIIRPVNPLKVKRLLEDQKHRLPMYLYTYFYFLRPVC